MKSTICLLVVLIIIASCDQKQNKVHDPVIVELPSGGDFYVSIEGEGPTIEEGKVIDVNIDPLSTEPDESRRYAGPLLVRRDQLSTEQFELFTRLSVGDNAIVTFKQGSSLEVKVNSMRELVADKQDSLRLLDLYRATNGPNWKKAWDISSPVKTWNGIELNVLGKVTKINLSENGLIGTLPSSLMGLDALTYLLMNENEINGRVKTLNEMHEFTYTGSSPNSNRIKDSRYYFVQDSLMVVEANSGNSLILKANAQLQLVKDDSLGNQETRKYLGFSGIDAPYRLGSQDSIVTVFSPFVSNTPIIPFREDSILSAYHIISSSHLSYPIVQQEDGSWTVNEQSDGYENTSVYNLENGLIMRLIDGYEYAELSLDYPIDKYSMHDVFLLSIRIFPEELRRLFKENGLFRVPTEPIVEQVESHTLIIEMTEDGELMRFLFEARDCGDNWSIELFEKSIRVNNFAGC